MTNNKQVWLQVTAGQGPVECAWAVVQVVQRIQDEARAASLESRVVEIEPGPETGTAQSALLALSGGLELVVLAESWRGTVQFVARSPFRPEHKRKNWFVGVELIEPVTGLSFDPRDVRWETMRASGPGGQHVNRTESAVRVTHIPTGLQATASEERSQHRNRALALARLNKKLKQASLREKAEAQERRWRIHQEVVRGEPVRVLHP